MVKGTTPTITFEFDEGLDMTQFRTLHIACKQGEDVLIEKRGDSITVDDEERNKVSISLTQGESLKLDADTTTPLEVQLTAIDYDGNRFSTIVYHIPVTEVLYDKVLK